MSVKYLIFCHFYFLRKSYRVNQFNAKELKDFLYENGVIVRYYSKPEELASCFRVSVGKPEHTMKLQTLLTAFEKENSND
jgi:histidinol-phosphate/aromatic aminotransferase/cobyric acid decarboxylase-like protein